MANDKKIINPIDVKKVYDDGKNISAHLREKFGVDYNSPEIIEITYDLQAGSYSKYYKTDKQARSIKEKYSKELSKVILKLCKPESILEAGVGEANTLAHLLDNFDKDLDSYGFDISYSRLLYAREYLGVKGYHNTQLCMGNLFDIPFLDDSIDVVYTSHSIEPNGGKEEEILKELYRVTNRYLILLEPAYDLSSEDIRKRMDSHGYCKGLKEKALKLGFDVLKYELFPYSQNLDNPTAITIIRKNNLNSTDEKDKFACPKFKTKLIPYKKNQALYSHDSLIMYPIIDDIPCLRVENGILATKLLSSELKRD